MEEDLVSVIMATYNDDELLRKSIDGILMQSYSNLELVITDDGSLNPHTKHILEEYTKKDPRVKVFFQKENGGPGIARNNSIKHAQGRYIAFCDSDDVWMKDKLEKQVRFMNEHHCALSFGSYIIIDDRDNETGLNMAPSKITFSQLKRDNKIGCSTAMYDTIMLGKKYYMPTLRKRQDWGLFLTILQKCKVAYGMQIPTVYYRVRKQSISNNKKDLVKYNIDVYKTVLGFNPIKALVFFLFAFMPTYIVKIIKRRNNSQRHLKYKTK